MQSFLSDGFDEDEAERDNFAVRVTGPDDPGILYNLEVCAQQDKLATMNYINLLALTLSHSHMNQIFKNILGRAKSDAPGIVDGESRIVEGLVKLKDENLVRKSQTGLRWEVFPAKMAQEEPQALHDISQAANIKGGKAMMETEMQGMLRLGCHCTSSANLAAEMNYEAVRSLLSSTMPKFAASTHFKDMFALVINLGGSTGPWLPRLKDFYGQWINGDIRKLRLGDLALMGSWPIRLGEDFPEDVRGKELAPLIVGIVQAMYGADLDKYLKEDHLEFISPKDVKLDKDNTGQMQRLHDALRAFKFLNQDWQPALAAVGRGVRIHMMGNNDMDIACAFLQKDEGLARLCQIEY